MTSKKSKKKSEDVDVQKLVEGDSEITCIVLKAYEYKGYPIVIRRIGDFYFEYILFFDNKFYSRFVEVPGMATQGTINVLAVGAETTIDVLLRESAKSIGVTREEPQTIEIPSDKKKEKKE